MKKLLIGAGVSALLAVGAVAARADDAEIELNATVADFCALDVTASAADLAPVFPTITDGKVPSGLPTLDITIGNVVCNGNSSVTLSSAKGAVLADTAPVPAAGSGFQNYINYKASVAVPTGVTLEANRTTGVALLKDETNTSSTPTNDAVVVTLEAVPTPAGQSLVADTYNDVLTLTIDASP